MSLFCLGNAVQDAGSCTLAPLGLSLAPLSSINALHGNISEGVPALPKGCSTDDLHGHPSQLAEHVHLLP